ncbi:MAG: hypothetical protein MZW92_53720 [Comamonadaceae bacterium]|nr:hypothetical protein [Comamonadaceae bacterium]
MPLVEIVTEPDLAVAADAAEFARRLRATLVAIGASDANMEEGGLRCDANVSLRRRGRARPRRADRDQEPQLVPRAPARPRVRNRAAGARARRQAVASRSKRASGTRRPGARVGMRTKEDSEDYRYFPEPDLPPLAISPERLARLRAALPELPEAREARLASAYGLGDDDAAALARTPGLAAYFERTAQASGDAAAACLWVRGELSRRLAEAGLTRRGQPRRAAGARRPHPHGARPALVSASAAKQILGRMMATGGAAAAIAARRRPAAGIGAEALDALVDATLSRHPVQVAQYRAGNAPSPGSSSAR